MDIGYTLQLLAALRSWGFLTRARVGDSGRKASYLLLLAYIYSMISVEGVNWLIDIPGYLRVSSDPLEVILLFYQYLEG